MAHRRGKRWVASGYDRSAGAKRHLGTFDTKSEAVRVEADWKLRSRATGTVGVVALRHDRSFIGIDLSPDYCEMARRRIVDDAPLLNHAIEVVG